MMAPRDQLTRWLRLLDVPMPTEESSSTALMTTSGRRFLVAAARCAARIDEQTDAAASDLPPLRPLPVRRPAAEGALVADAVWVAYLHSRAGNQDAIAWMRSFIATLAPTALVFSADDNPEPWWQNEMVILHAVHSFALRSGDEAVVKQSLDCADYHLREIQPDHATNEPWAVHAYASHPDGNVTAETLWHAGYIQHGGDLGPVARHLARDARDALAVYFKA